MSAELSGISSAALEVALSATLAVETRGKGFTEITDDAARFLAKAGAHDGSLLLFMRHTSASLVIQENADPDVRTDLAAALARVAPEDGGWVHDVEGPDDARSCEDDVHGCFPARSRARRRLGAGHLAGHLCRRAPRPAAPAGGRAAVHR
jgi:hypothetical protein